MSVSVNTGAGDDGRVSLYIDGTEVFRDDGSNTNFGTDITAGGSFIFGQDQDGSTPGGGFQSSQRAIGEVGDIRVWGVERDQEDIDLTKFKQFEALDLKDHPALVANWQLDLATETFDNLAGSQGLSINSPGGNDFTASSFSHDGGDDSIDGGSGNDMIDAGSGNDIVIAGIGNDVVEGSCQRGQC